MGKSASQRLNESKEPKQVLLKKDFAGAKRGQWLFVATPKIIAEYIGQIPYGQTRSISMMRDEIASKRKCDTTCPRSTSIFIRIAAQAALEQLEEGKSLNEVVPFWRIITGKDRIAKRLDIDPTWIDQQRQLELSS